MKMIYLHFCNFKLNCTLYIIIVQLLYICEIMLCLILIPPLYNMKEPSYCLSIIVTMDKLGEDILIAS